eukprot:scaffold26604_cov116-Isochrysis_galbana.AAC.4
MPEPAGPRIHLRGSRFAQRRRPLRRPSPLPDLDHTAPCAAPATPQLSQTHADRVGAATALRLRLASIWARCRSRSRHPARLVHTKVELQLTVSPASGGSPCQPPAGGALQHHRRHSPARGGQFAS